MQVGNIQPGIPVRVTRKKSDPESIYGNVYIFAGLYDVVGSPIPLNPGT